MRTKQFALGTLLLVGLSASGQHIWGHSTIDIDPTTSTVTATCSTELDAAAEGAYNAEVTCTVIDGNGNLIDSEDAYDDGTGNVESTITFTGTPGTTYNVTGSHMAFAYLDYGEYYDEPILRGWGDDPFNFFSFTENPGNYADDFTLYGPGPEEMIRNRTLLTANTHAKKHYPKITININFGNSAVPMAG